MGTIALFLTAAFFFCPIILSQDINFLKNRYRVPGVAVAVIKEGKVKIECFGYANRALQEKVTPTSLFQVASISKPITALLILKLAEQGKIDLDEPIEKYLTRWRFPPSPYPTEEVTIRRILNHTSGLSVPSYSGYLSYRDLPTLEATLNGIKGSHRRLEISAYPGKAFRYSGGGYTLLQLLIEEISLDSFQHQMSQELFSPLGLVDASFALAVDQKNRLCTPYDIWGRPMKPLYFIEQAAAGMYTNIENLTVLILHILESYRQGSLYAKQLCSGLGFEVENLAPGVSLAYHFGANPGWRGGVFLLPAHNCAMAILTNSDRGSSIIYDLSSKWIEEETNISPSFFHEVLVYRRVVHFMIGFFALIFLYFFIKNWKNKKGNFWWSILTIFGWYWVFYAKNPFLDGWVISSFLPTDFEWISMIVILSSIGNISIKLRQTLGE